MVSLNRRHEDNATESTRLQKVNYFLKSNVHILIISLPLLFGAATTLGFQWKGSPQSIITHVDHADSTIIELINNHHLRERVIDSLLAVRVGGLGDTVSVILAKQLILINIMCGKLTAEEQRFIAYIINCKNAP